MQEAFGQQGLKSIKGLDGSPRVLDKNELLARVEAGKRLFQAQTDSGYKTVDGLISGGVKRLLPKLKTNKIEFENIANQLESKIKQRNRHLKRMVFSLIPEEVFRRTPPPEKGARRRTFCTNSHVTSSDRE